MLSSATVPIPTIRGSISSHSSGSRLDYPELLQIETTRICPAHCSFCVYSRRNSPKGMMEERLFRRLIDEAAAWPVSPRIAPFSVNEPFADPRMADLCLYVNERLPRARLTFFTIGALFTERRLETLRPVQGVESVFLSLHHSDPEEYRQETGLSFAATIASIHRFLAFQSVYWPAAAVTLLRVQDGDAEKDCRFQDFCGREFPGVPTQLSYRYDWAGKIDSPWPYADTLDIVCPRHSGMVILADGRVALCCLDAEGSYALGDASRDSLLSIYNSPRARSYRSRTKRECGSPCSTCNMRA